MEAMKHQQGTMNKFSQSIFLKMATVVSVSVFSLIFSYSFSSYAVQIAHSIDKRYVFLLCNGILVVIVMNSAGLIDNSQQESHHAHDQDLPAGKKDLNKGHHNQAQVLFNASEQKQRSIKEEVAQEQETQNLSTSVCMACVAEEQEQIELQDNASEEYANIAADQEDGSGLPSVEELNKKCDDFIRKMKIEIKFRNQQLIVTN